MKSLMKQLLLTILLSIGLFQIGAIASHISGGSIKYKSLGNNLYYIEAAVFRDCNGAGYSSRTETVDAVCTSNSGAGWTVHTVSHLAFVAPTPAPFGGPYGGITVGTGTNALVAEEVSDVCDKLLDPSRSPSTKCRNRNNTAQGYMRFKFSAVITLSSCNWWRLGFSPVCCRNTGSSNTSSGGMYVHTFINTKDFPTNSAPDFADEVKPIPSACVGKKVYYGIGTIDYDGDSLRFELACAMQDSTRCVSYSSGFSAKVPAAGMKMDSVTGLLSFTPATAGKRVVAFWVKEYERCTGVLKAKTLRDVQFRVESCSNNVPRDVSGISNIQGNNFTLLDSFRMEVCNGEYITFEDTIVDIDSAAGKPDTLLFSSNYDKVLTGATMTVNYITKTKAVVKWSWRASIGINPVKIFYLVFNDDFCDYPGNGFSVFELNVRNSTNGGRDTAVCRGDTVHLNASGGKLYQWKSVYGDSLYYSGPKQNIWSDTTIADTNRTMKFLPSKTTLLEVWSDLQEGCIAAQACSVRDTIKIVVADTFNVSMHMDTLICFNDSTIPIFVKPDRTTSTYNYKWSPSGYVDYDTVRNPNATPILSKPYYVTVTSDSGCVRTDSMKLNVTPPFPSKITATASDTDVCQGTKTTLDLEMGYRPTACGLTKGICIGAVQKLDLGNGTTKNASTGGVGAVMWPCPYGNDKESSRQQFLYRSGELSASGVSNGIIQGIGFYVEDIKGTSTYSKYSIKLKCTSKNALSAAFEAGAVQVFTPKTVTIQKGWNYHAFNTDYDYDGSSNLLVEICYENSGTSLNSEVRYTTTSFQSCVVAYGSSAMCATQFISLSSYVNRPNIQFSVCQAPDPGAFTYKWTPSTYLNHDTIKSPIATIGDSLTYYAFIEDTFKKCSGVSTKIHIDLIALDLSKDTILCPLDTIGIDAKPRTTCSGIRTYKWTASDTSAYISNDTVSNPQVMAQVNTEFYLSFNDTCGCTINDTFRIDMRKLAPPTINRTPPNCGKDNGVLQIIGNGGLSPYSYTLAGGGKNLANSNGVFNTLNNGYYTLRVTDDGKCFTEFVDTFTNTAPIIDSITSENLICYKEQDGEIDIFASEGIPPLAYSIDGGANYLTANSFSALEAGKYSVIVMSNDLCTTKPIEITLIQPDSLFATLYYSEVTCNGDGDAWANGVAFGGTTPYNYNWGNGSIQDSALNLSGGLDSLVLTDVNSCRYSKTINILEFPEVVLDSVDYTNSSCNAYDDGKIEMFARGGKQALFYSKNQGGTYTQFNSFSKLEPETYYLSVRDINNCAAYDTIKTIEPPEVRLTAAFDSTRICVSTCADMVVNGSGGNISKYSYHWTPGISSTLQVQRVCPDESSTYWVYAKDTAGCISLTKKIRVELFDSLKVETSEDREICLYQNTELPVVASGGDGRGFVYQWFPQIGLNNPNLSNPIASPDVATTYTVILRDLCGSPSASNTVRVEVRPLPMIDFTADVTEACHPAKIIYRNTSPNQGLDCVWDFGNGIQFNSCLEAPTIYNRPGTYNVTLSISDEFGCRDSLTKGSFVNVLRSPFPLFDWEPEKPTTQNPDVQFKDLSVLDIVEWEWTFGSFGTSNEQHPKVSFPETHEDRYPVKLSVKGENGCAADTIYIIEIGPEFSLYIPKAFSPNGDGINDVFIPVGKGIDPEEFQMFVYNRWGELLFKSINPSEGWDGTDSRSGEVMKAGVYPFRFLIGDTFNDKERHEYRGTVTIVYSAKQE
jgi:gliding motility-associated-like protein